MVGNQINFFVNVGTRHSVLGKIDEADKLCRSVLNNFKPLVFEPINTKILFDIIKSY